LTEVSTAPLGSRRAHEQASAADKRARRFLLRLSLVNWGIAIVAWTISAALGIASPASIIVYTVLFVIGLFAVIVAIFTFLLEKFAHRPGAVLDEKTGEVYEPVAAAEAAERIGPGGRPIL
jgi:cation transporter-like permease